MQPDLINIALAIGNHLDLARMFGEALTAFCTSLHCEAAWVGRIKCEADGGWHASPVPCIPDSRPGMALMEDILRSLPCGTNPETLRLFYRQAPQTFVASGWSCLLAPLPEFGCLVLCRPFGRINEEASAQLPPLLTKLARAGLQCDQHALCRDEIRERKGTELAIRQEKAYLDQLFDNAQVGIIMARNDGTVLRINPEFERIFGYSPPECIGGNIDALIAPTVDNDHARDITRSVSRGAKHAFEAMRYAKNGTPVPVMVLASPIVLDGRQVAVYAFYRDVSVQKRMEAELLTAKKLEATGKLAGGIAHDFNNLLSALLGSISLAQIEAGNQQRVCEYLRQAEQVCTKARDLTRKFITFSTGGIPLKRMTDIRQLLRTVAAEVAAGGPGICRFELSEDLRSVMIDATQIRHVIQAVVQNALESMPAGGTVTLTARNLSSQEMAVRIPEAQGQDYLWIAIQDQGKGIGADALPLIFDPYYSTKEMGSQKGMGMGLTLAHSIMARHGGHIRVASKIGRGTTVSIYLPV